MSDLCQTHVRQQYNTIKEWQNMQRVTIRLPEQQIKLIDFMVQQGEFPSTSEAIRAAVRDLIDQRGEKMIRRREMMASALS
ncbi:MAG: ribbon-helix-helix domain-containing protein [Methanosarcinaceae archaeon]|nr:ribbon-helix-helix domain-containing protein [Methanosarcinaceae archaeon]